MASPLAHGLLGLSIARLTMPRDGRHRLAWYAFGALAADAADLDFVPGFLVGDINAFHHGGSHSILAALLFGAVATGLLWPVWHAPVRVWLVGSAAYLSHVVLDLFCAIPGVLVEGQPLFWPLSAARWKSRWEPFLGIHHGMRGDTLTTFLERVVCWHNVSAFGRELLSFLPLTIVIWLLTMNPKSPARGLAED